MSMTHTEKLLLEAIKEKFQTGGFGLPVPDKQVEADNNPRLRGPEYLHGQIDEMFQLKAAELIHHTGICAAFSKVHNYKYVDDTSFAEAFDKELVAQGVPKNERTQALEFIPKIIKELREEAKEWAEVDYGFHPDLDEIMTIPDQFEK